MSVISAIRIETGRLEADQGDLETGIADLERAVTLLETSKGFSGLAALYDRELVIEITALAEIPPERFIRPSQARPMHE